jgi:hypothetical protein
LLAIPALALAGTIGCAAAPVRTADQWVSEGVIRCKDRRPAISGGNGAHGDLANAARNAAEREYLNVVNELRSEEGSDALAQRTRMAMDPLEQFCALEMLVRTDPDRARRVYAEVESNPRLTYLIKADAYLTEALKPYPVYKKQP